MKRMLYALCIIMILLVTGCTTKSKLLELGYSDLDISKIETLDIAKILTKNKIDIELYRNVISHNNFDSNNYKAYFRLLNTAFNFEELDLLINGVNKLVSEDTKFLRENELNSGNALKIFKDNLKPTIKITKSEFEASNSTQDIDISQYIVAQSGVDNSKVDDISIMGSVEASVIGDKRITITIVDKYGYENIIEETISVKDTVIPVISFINNEFFEGNVIDYKHDFKCVDNFDGDISQLVEVDIIEGDLRNPGIHKINYTVVDSSGNKLEYIRKINILKLYKIGETIEIGQYTLQFLSYYYSDIDTEPQTGYYSYYTADDGQTFVIFKLKVYNNGKEASEPFDIWNKDSLNLDLVIGDGYTYEDTAHSLENNWYYYYVSLRSQQSKTLNLTFEIPDSKANNSEQKIIKINADTISDTKYLILD